MSEQDDDKSAIGSIGRQEIITGLLIVVLGMVSVGGILTLGFVFTDPGFRENLTISGDVDVGKFIDKAVESYDAFLLLLGVTSGSGGTIAAVKLGKSLAKG